MRRLRDSIRDRVLLIGVDRLDYSKGLPARFNAYSYLLEHYPESRGRTVFMQIAPPSRADVPEYREIRRELEAAAGNINGRYAEFDWTPLRYLNKSFNHRILTGFYRAARIGLVTPFRDGMNLVVKEYLASQDPNDPGMPVLSCFAGAAHELDEAIIVNPFDREGVAEADPARARHGGGPAPGAVERDDEDIAQERRKCLASTLYRGVGDSRSDKLMTAE